MQSGAVLEILLRMRQASNCLSLISEDRLAALEALEEQTMVTFTPENTAALRVLLQVSVDQADECPICMESLIAESRIPQITACKHIFCQSCITEAIQAQGKCPLCRTALSIEQLLGLPKAEAKGNTEKGESTKLKGLLSILQATHRCWPFLSPKTHRSRVR